jgi:hypothetical protein
LSLVELVAVEILLLVLVLPVAVQVDYAAQ